MGERVFLVIVAFSLVITTCDDLFYLDIAETSTSVRKVSFSGPTETVTLNLGSAGKDIYLVKVNVSGKDISATNTGGFSGSTVENIDTEGRGTNNMIKITGRVKIYGNEPHTFVGIVDEKGTEFAVYPREQEEKLRKLQGYLIEFTVIVLDEPKGEGSLYLKGGTVQPLEWSIIR